MSATIFLLILAGVVLVFVGFVIKSWSELSRVSRPRGTEDRGDDEHGD